MVVLMEASMRCAVSLSGIGYRHLMFELYIDIGCVDAKGQLQRDVA